MSLFGLKPFMQKPQEMAKALQTFNASQTVAKASQNKDQPGTFTLKRKQSPVKTQKSLVSFFLKSDTADSASTLLPRQEKDSKLASKRIKREVFSDGDNLTTKIDWGEEYASAAASASPAAAAAAAAAAARGGTSENLWETKIAPQSMKDIWGHEEQKTFMMAWLLKGKPYKPILLCGATGSGKTSLSRALYNSRGLQIWDESMLEGSDSLVEGLSVLFDRNPLCGSVARGILIECAEGISSKDCSALITLLKNRASTLSIPIIITCDDEFHPALKAFKSKDKSHSVCTVQTLRPLKKSEALAYLCTVSKVLHQPMSLDSADILYENAKGNLRFALNEFEFLRKTLCRKKFTTVESGGSSLAECDTSWNLFKEVGRICSGILDSRSEEIANSDFDIAMLMLHHNLPSCSANSINVLARGLDAICSADILEDYHQNQIAACLTVKGSALSCRGSGKSSMPYIKFPCYLAKMSSAKTRARNSIASASVECDTLSLTAFDSMERLCTLHEKVKIYDAGGVKGCKELKKIGLWHEKKECNELLRIGIQWDF